MQFVLAIVAVWVAWCFVCFGPYAHWAISISATGIALYATFWLAVYGYASLIPKY